MIVFFRTPQAHIYAVQSLTKPSDQDIAKLQWLFSGAVPVAEDTLHVKFIGPRKEMVSPWSTNAVEITQIMGIAGILRIEEFVPASSESKYDRMLMHQYEVLGQDLFDIQHTPEPITAIADIAAYNKQEGLALSDEEVAYLENVSKELGRKLTDSEVFGFSQVNSEHCRHKIFNGTFIIDGEEKPSSLFQLIKLTSKTNPNLLVSAYKDNVAFIKGPVIQQFSPIRQDIPEYFTTKSIESVLSLKAETHNFPTTVEPFNGAATGSGGEIRDRLAGGKGSIPLAGTAVYMTSYPRLNGLRPWEKKFAARKWLYQTPEEILIKASDGASDFGNKFGQPLINGSLLTFEHFEANKKYGFDKVIMLAGGIGYGKLQDSQKEKLQAGDKIVMMGGDNYRIGMGGSAVSSVATGEYGNAIELNAIQRSNPEMQKRVMNAIRAMVESDQNPIVSIHDHGAGGHLNCFSELLEDTGGTIHIDQLPVGDPTLSDKEIISNESQERMGLAIKAKDIEQLQKVAERERAPMYVVGEASGDEKLVYKRLQGKAAVDLSVRHFFGSSPKTIITDQSAKNNYKALSYQTEKLQAYLEQVLQLEAVACKDWLTNKVDRCVTGRVAKQQTCGPLQLPLSNVGVMALDYSSNKGIATAIGHAPAVALIHPAHGSKLAIAEALSNIIWAPLTHGLKGVSLSANWMWPSKNKGEDAKLYQAVEAVSDFACKLGINIPTGKDSLSMAQKYPDGEVVLSPGTVIISAMAEVDGLDKIVDPVLQAKAGTQLLYVNLAQDSFALGGSSFAQVLNLLGDATPSIQDDDYFVKVFACVQELIKSDLVLAGHDVSAGGLITAALEMCFAQPGVGVDLNADVLTENDLIKIAFSEQPALLIQVENEAAVKSVFEKQGVAYHVLGNITNKEELNIQHAGKHHTFHIPALRDVWFNTSYLLDKAQRPEAIASARYQNYKSQALDYIFPKGFIGTYAVLQLNPKRKSKSGIKAAIIREKGVNGDREMAYAMHLAGFDVKDVHMTDLVSGREDLSDVNFIAFVGGFSNSDVLGSAKGWAGAFLYNPKAKQALDNFYARPDTISLGVCNGCQLMMELGLLYPEMKAHPKMHHNASGKFESIFLSVDIPENNSVMLGNMAGSKLGIWVAHGEGKFILPGDKGQYNFAAHYTHNAYPGNPNGSDYATAALCSKDGRHLAIMPHLERSSFPWNWGYYPAGKKSEDVSPWIMAFMNAFEWVKENKNS